MTAAGGFVCGAVAMWLAHWVALLVVEKRRGR
jgi:hypothetical protein